MYDVIVSGAGPAGSKCAEVLAKSGYNVALIERDTTWRKPCGGAVSNRIFKYYPKIRDLDFQRIYGISMYSANYFNFTYSWKGIQDYSINVDRLEFDNFIRDTAIDAGAVLFDKNISYDFITKNEEKIGIKTKASSGINEFLGKIIVIADGMGSKLAIKSGLRKKWKIEEIYTTKCAIMEGDNLLDKEIMSIFFRPYKGYGWIFPLGGNKFNIGVGLSQEMYRKYNVNNFFFDFLHDPYVKKLLPSPKYKGIWKSSYPLPALGIKEKSLIDDNIMIIGDAAGFVSPISGEGIHASIVSGQVAAETAIMALENEMITKEYLRKYKSHPYIKKIIRNFKLKSSLTNFFFENEGRNLSQMFDLAKKEVKFREELINLFLFNQAPSQEFILKTKER
jgi:geranylgeranyl reductase family protein